MNKIKLKWLETEKINSGRRNVTWGVPWPQGELEDPKILALVDENGNELPVHSAGQAFWQDGSIKWSGHSANLNGNQSSNFYIKKGSNKTSGEPLTSVTNNGITVKTGKIEASFNLSGNKIINSVVMDGKTVVSGARLICVIENVTKESNCLTRTENTFIGEIESIIVEDNNHIRSVVKASGTHKKQSNGETILQFVIRFYFYKDSDDIKITHTFIYDGDQNKDFIKGIGIEFETPVFGEVYNRHIKIAGDNGYFHEASRFVASWRPRISPEIYKKQLSGEMIDFTKEIEDEAVRKSTLDALEDTAVWDSYKIYQDSSEHYIIRKKTVSDEVAYIDAVHGGRSKGLAFAGCKENGIAVGLRHFWEKFPSALYIDNLSSDTVKITAWIWTPDAQAADMRHYDTVAHMLSSYEGFNEIRSTPYGISNTNELYLRCFTGIASDNELDYCIQTLNNPPVLICEPEYYHNVKAFGLWGLVDKNNSALAEFEEMLDRSVDFYINEVEQRKWYGLFNYGDFMHTYDDLRHSWKYDVGGYAWQNTELVPTMWLWLAFLRSGRPDIYRLAEAMSRHTSEVDVYHIGEYKGLGSRHNVIHWGCSCKEARIAMAGHHRYMYYLTCDERLGDIFEDVRDAEYGIERLDPLRFFYNDEQRTHARSGPDWSSLSANWMTAWERKGDAVCREKLLKGIECIKKMPFRLISGSDFGFDPDSGELFYIGESAAGGSHLVICMGGPQVWFEMADFINDPVWNEMLAEYGGFYHLSNEEKSAYSGGKITGRGWSHGYMSSAMAAYAAWYKKDDEFAKKVWAILKGEIDKFKFEILDVTDFSTSSVKSEMRKVSTNFIAQWCLNVITCMGIIGDKT